MADGNSGTNSMMGVVIGALIVILVGGGILYATGVVGGPKTTTVNVSVPPAAAPASAPAHPANVPDRHPGGFDRRDDRRDDHRPDGHDDNRDRR